MTIIVRFMHCGEKKVALSGLGKNTYEKVDKKTR